MFRNLYLGRRRILRRARKPPPTRPPCRLLGPLLLLLLVFVMVALRLSSYHSIPLRPSEHGLNRAMNVSRLMMLPGGAPMSDPMQQQLKWAAHPPTCLLVYHIPKTGGTSLERFWTLMAWKMGKNWVYRDWDLYARNLPGSLPVLLDPKRSFTDRHIHEGHLTPNFEYVTKTQSCAKVTVLRDPVDRVVSAFYFHRAGKNHSVEVWHRCLYESCWLDFEYMNDMTRRFANRGVWWNSFDRDKYLHGKSPRRDLDGAALDDAKKRLLLFDAVCFLPNVKECMERFASNTFRVNVTLPPYVRNANANKTEVSMELRKEIAASNALDILLYGWALQTFINR